MRVYGCYKVVVVEDTGSYIIYNYRRVIISVCAALLLKLLAKNCCANAGKIVSVRVYLFKNRTLEVGRHNDTILKLF